MKPSDFRRIPLSFEGAKRPHRGSPDFRVAGRSLPPWQRKKLGYGNVKLTPEQTRRVLRERRESLDCRRVGPDGYDHVCLAKATRRGTGALRVAWLQRKEKKERKKEDSQKRSPLRRSLARPAPNIDPKST